MKIRELTEKLNKILEEHPDCNKEVMFAIEYYDAGGRVDYLDYHEVVDVTIDRGAIMLEHEFAF